MADAVLEMQRCESCRAEFTPRAGPCPRCGGLLSERTSVEPTGRVLAATQLEVPAPGWTAPHRIVLVEVARGIRLLCVVRGALPATGDEVTVGRDGAVYSAV